MPLDLVWLGSQRNWRCCYVALAEEDAGFSAWECGGKGML